MRLELTEVERELSAAQGKGYEEQNQINKAIEIAERERGVSEVKAFLILKQYGSLKKSGKPKKNIFSNIFKPKTSNKTYNKKRSNVIEEDIKPQKTVTSKNEDKTEPQKSDKQTLDTNDLDKEYEY